MGAKGETLGNMREYCTTFLSVRGVTDPMGVMRSAQFMHVLLEVT
jgi:hypothetical protein